jgi:hypothetical protein
VLNDIVALERDPEKEPQRRYSLIEGRYADAAASEMQLIAAHVLEACRVGRAAEKYGEVLDSLHVVMLFGTELPTPNVRSHGEYWG